MNENIVFVGFGEGTHIAEWLRAHPRGQATVVESGAGHAKVFRRSHGDVQGRCDFVIVSEASRLLTCPLMETMASHAPTVLMSRPANEEEALFLNACFATLTGRNRSGLTYFLKKFGLHDDGAVIEDGRLLTIRDLGLVIDSAADGPVAAQAVRVLRELVI